MKVTNHLPSTVSAAHDSSVGEKAASQGKKGPSNTYGPANQSSAAVEISEKARLFNHATELAMGAPETRTEKIATLKKNLNEGTYRLDPEAIAEKLIREHLNSDFGKNRL